MPTSSPTAVLGGRIRVPDLVRLEVHAEVDSHDVKMIVDEFRNGRISEDVLKNLAVHAPICSEIQEHMLPVFRAIVQGLRNVFWRIGRRESTESDGGKFG
jgi:hypothetical protein